MPEIINQYPVASIQWEVESGKWEAIETMATIAARHNCNISPLLIIYKISSRACQPQRPQFNSNFGLSIQTLL
jgi:hypothetical protein